MDTNLNIVEYLVCQANVLELQRRRNLDAAWRVSVLLCFSMNINEFFVLIACGWLKFSTLESN